MQATELQPEGFVQISTSFLKPDCQYCFVICTGKLPGHQRGSYCLVNLTTAVEDGDWVVVGEDRLSMNIMRLCKPSAQLPYWSCVGVSKQSRLHPIILLDAKDLVLGKVEQVFDLPRRHSSSYFLKRVIQ
jgi:hypothetical protein